MKIICDAEGKQTIVNLLDVALKSGGYANLEVSNKILKSLENVKDFENKSNKITVEEVE